MRCLSHTVGLLAASICLGSCYQPHPPEGLLCSAENLCPAGQYCAIDGRCHSKDSLPGVIDADTTIPDAGCAPDEQSWMLRQRLIRQNAAAGDTLGSSVAVGERLLVVGWDGDDLNGNAAGAVLVFSFAGGRWQEVATLRAADGDATDYLGRSVTVSGTTIAAGAYLDEAAAPRAGAAYLFSVDGSTSQLQKLTPTGGDATDLGLGNAMDLDGLHLAVGASGTASKDGMVILYEGTTGNWVEVARVTNDDFADADARYFGKSVSLEGQTLLVGASGTTVNAETLAGAAYVLQRNGSSFTLVDKLVASDAAANDSFGTTSAMDGNTLAVGAEGDDNENGEDAGAVYVYEKTDANWTFVTKLIAPNGKADDDFGVSVDIFGDRILVGASSFDTQLGDNAGAAFLYRKSGGSWDLEAMLTDDQSSASARFGTSVAMDDGKIVVLAPFDDLAAENAGTAMYFAFGCPPQ